MTLKELLLKLDVIEHIEANDWRIINFDALDEVILVESLADSEYCPIKEVFFLEDNRTVLRLEDRYIK